MVLNHSRVNGAPTKQKKTPISVANMPQSLAKHCNWGKVWSHRFDTVGLLNEVVLFNFKNEILFSKQTK